MSLGELDAGDYTFTLRVRDLHADFMKERNPRYTEQAVQTGATTVRVADVAANDKVDGSVALPSVAAKQLKSSPGSGKRLQCMGDHWRADANGPSVPTIHYLEFKDGMDGILKPGHSSVGSYDFSTWKETPKTNADYALPRYHSPTVGMPVCLWVRSTYMGLSDSMTLREVEWVGDRKVVVRLDMWRDGIEAADDYPRVPVLLLPLYEGVLPLQEPGEYEVQIEWNLWYDEEASVYQRITLDDVDEAKLPDALKTSYKYMATEQAVF